MIALGLVLPLATACAVAATLRLASTTGYLLAVYLLVIGEIVAMIEFLSAFAGVREWDVLVVESLLLLGGGVAFIRRRAWVGLRPKLPRSLLLELRANPPVMVLLVAVAAALGYELALAIATPPNNWDSMSYHLSRAAAWYQHHRVSYIDAHTDRENALQPNAEILVLFTFVFAHGDRLAAVWQWLAEVASLLAIYTIARRLRFARPAALLGALLFASLSQTVLQASTTQNDLLTASFVVTAVAFLATEERVRLPLAAIALGLAIGTKLTTAFAFPAVALIAGLLVPRREWMRFAALVVAMTVSFGAFGYALNLAQTGSPQGAGCATVGWCQHSWIGRGESVLGVAAGTLVDFRPSPDEDLSYFGPLGVVLVIPIVVLTLRRWRRREAPAIHGALAAAFPLYVLVLAVFCRYNPWLGRFMLIPAALVAPLFGTIQRTPRYAAVVSVVALVTLGSALLFNHAKPSGLAGGASIWNMTRIEAQTVQRPAMRPVLAALQACVPASARIGYVLNADDWDYPLYGRSLSRSLVRLSNKADQTLRQPLPVARLRGLSWALVRKGLITAVPTGWTQIRFHGTGLELLVRTANTTRASNRCPAR